MVSPLSTTTATISHLPQRSRRCSGLFVFEDIPRDNSTMASPLLAGFDGTQCYPAALEAHNTLTGMAARESFVAVGDEVHQPDYYVDPQNTVGHYDTDSPQWSPMPPTPALSFTHSDSDDHDELRSPAALLSIPSPFPRNHSTSPSPSKSWRGHQVNSLPPSWIRTSLSPTTAHVYTSPGYASESPSVLSPPSAPTPWTDSPQLQYLDDLEDCMHLGQLPTYNPATKAFEYDHADSCVCGFQEELRLLSLHTDVHAEVMAWRQSTQICEASLEASPSPAQPDSPSPPPPTSPASHPTPLCVAEFVIVNVDGKKRFKCQYPDCDASTTARHNLINHWNFCHSHIKQYACRLGCDRSFTTASDLNRHETKTRTHTDRPSRSAKGRTGNNQAVRSGGITKKVSAKNKGSGKASRLRDSATPYSL
ncbi:hypothetical protein CYLTODRAFT_486280 [Cylindrobasidium torrendii FP15055 ss-10]|uniref:C2H2-type domain-containing protein n=1 Tax=Cylindrobasidium torrendii FP15055 ss-10 TaxID=1314674 RepID=A0A0D7BQC6_9AGAR|nr:hypothetical protein CYLTODRAFT_486280 [Cylindrobasidium torrendii FP15055 ss-10]